MSVPAWHTLVSILAPVSFLAKTICGWWSCWQRPRPRCRPTRESDSRARATSPPSLFRIPEMASSRRRRWSSRSTASSASPPMIPSVCLCFQGQTPRRC
ncbi:hypothetical protein BRADI_1g20312v3 [Brachypodium distachyon]|uniref:Uncharacterized protein n=1 Tax=Brachypodium distachyon TaxID=15368 RepID=A0A2K2DK74_BRADI|nr:hypothetical protein BRADI_1g20312v3 [Brachypodium distachyon]